MIQYTGTPGAAELLGISPSAVRALIRRGSLGAVYVDGRLLIRLEEVRRLAADPGYRSRTRSSRARRAS